MSKKQIAFIIKVITPYISVLSGGVVAFLYSHIGLFSAFHFSQDQTATAIASIAVFAITSGLTYLSAHTKIIPEIEKWAETIIGHDFVAGELMASVAPAQTHITINGDRVVVHQGGQSVPGSAQATSGDASPTSSI